MDKSDLSIQIEPPEPPSQPKHFYFGQEHLHHLPASESAPSTRTQGWITGVLMPSAQNMVGIIVFVRMAWITGQAGIGLALLILTLCQLTTFLTALSMSAIATNGKIPAGGSYYILARSLGPSFGGSIGMLYYFGLISACGMYTLGAIETFIESVGYDLLGRGGDIRILGLILLSLIFVLNLVGMKYVSRVSIILLSVLSLSFLCTYIGIFSASSRSDKLPDHIDGLSNQNFKANFDSAYGNGVSFHILLAIFYPSVTGFMAGSNRSAHLTNPSQAIPKGTISAICIIYTVYFSLICLFGAVSQRDELLDNKYFVSTVAWPHPSVVNLGIILSTIGAALQSMAGAPKILSSIASDNLLPLKWFVRENDALKLSAVMAALIVMIGSLDDVAPIITMFFLLFYGFINIACCLLSLLGNPSWRPKWPYYHWITALLGSILCFSLMVYISWWAACVSFILAGVLYYYIDMKTQATNWGDGMTGLRQQRAKKALLGVHPSKVQHVKNWKPQILVLDYLTEQDEPKHPGLLSIIEQLKKGNGLSIFGSCKLGEENMANFRESKLTKSRLYDYFKSRRIEVFTKVVLAKSVKSGLKNLIQNSGLGGLEPNTVLLAWPENWRTEPIRAARFCKLIDYSQMDELAVLTIKPAKQFEGNSALGGTIDIWWFCYDGGLMCLLVYLLKKHRVWRNCTARIFYVVIEGSGIDDIGIQEKLKEWVNNYRMFESVMIQIVVVPADALMQHHSTIMNDEQRIAKKASSDFTPMIVLDEIEHEQIERARQIVLKEKADIDEKLESMGLKGRSSTVEDDGVSINKKILEYSSDADLVITGLPGKPKEQDPSEYLAFCEAMTQGLTRVLMVSGTENSVVTDLT